jgi:hypothetical protein
MEARSTNEAAEEAVARALDRFARTDPRCRKATRAILAAQRWLKGAVTEEQWQLYLLVEERVSARDRELVDAAIRIALRWGRRLARAATTGR